MPLVLGRGVREGWGLRTPLHMEASLASAFLVSLRRWRASPVLALLPGEGQQVPLPTVFGWSLVIWVFQVWGVNEALVRDR